MSYLAADTFYTTKNADGVYYLDRESQAWKISELKSKGATIERIPRLPLHLHLVDETALTDPFIAMLNQLRESTQNLRLLIGKVRVVLTPAGEDDHHEREC